MNLYQNKQYKNIIDKVVASSDIWLELSKKSFFITGATGLIGSGLCDVLLYVNEKYELGLKVYVAVRNIEQAKIRFEGCYSSEAVEFCAYDAVSMVNKLPDADFYIHAASPATPDQMTGNPIGVNKANLLGTMEILDYVRTRELDSRVVYISSSEIYGNRSSGDEDRPWREDELGKLNHLTIRASYASSKRATENLCISYNEQYGINTIIIRPGHIYGPTARKSDMRASSDFAYMAAAGEDIVMHSDGSQIRSYMHVMDAAMAILHCAVRGAAGEVYNISNPDSVISIRQMTEVLCAAGGSELKIVLPTDENKKNDNPMKNSSLDASKLYGLGYKAVIGYEEGLRNTVDVLKNV